MLIEFDLEDAFGPNPERLVVHAVAPLALLKFIAETKKWIVRVSQLDFRRFVDPMTLQCDSKSLCKHMADLTLTAGVTAQDYETELEALSAAGHDASQIARGHDATSLLAWVIPIVGGKKKKHGAPITSYAIEGYLRTAYPTEAFAKSDLYVQIEEWEKRNIPYKVLRK